MVTLKTNLHMANFSMVSSQKLHESYICQTISRKLENLNSITGFCVSCVNLFVLAWSEKKLKILGMSEYCGVKSGARRKGLSQVKDWTKFTFQVFYSGSFTF